MKNYIDTTVFYTILYNEKIKTIINYWGLFVDEGSRSGFFPDPNPDDSKRLDRNESGSATLLSTLFDIYKCELLKNVKSINVKPKNVKPINVNVKNVKA